MYVPQGIAFTKQIPCALVMPPVIKDESLEFRIVIVAYSRG